MKLTLTTAGLNQLIQTGLRNSAPETSAYVGQRRRGNVLHTNTLD